MHQVKVSPHSGGFHKTMLDPDFLPRVGETIDLANWRGVVTEVIHRPAFGRDEGRKEDRPSTEIRLAEVHENKQG